MNNRSTKSILIIDDDKDFRHLIKRPLVDAGLNCLEADTREKTMEVLATNHVDLVLCDLNLRKENGKDILIHIKEEFPALPVIIITGYSNVRTAVEMIRLGAVDYLLKPLIPAELVFIINKRIGEVLGLTDQPAPLPASLPPPARTVPEQTYVFSPGEFLQGALKQIDLVAPTDYSVIIYGESGSGKEAFAQEIHKRSKRKAKPFLAIDCGALSKELSASILFGHEKGAFTGAIGEKKGAFEISEGGTVFLDEVGNLPYEIQVSLLRVMQERKTRRVGGTRDIPIDVRIIVASNTKLWDASRKGTFREDLYHRFNEFSLDVKPLRERKSDILFYANHFLAKSNAELAKNVTGFTDQAMNALMDYRWPGNLRELRNLVKRCVLITEFDKIGIDLLPAEFFQPPASSDSQGTPKSPTDYFTAAAEQEYRLVIETLQRTGFDKKKAGGILNMDVSTINSKIKTFADLHGFKVTF